MPSITSRSASVVIAGALAIVALTASPIGSQGTPFIVLMGPAITGAIAARRRKSWRAVAAAWSVSGLLMLVIDWLINNEDHLFHLILAALMAALTALGASLGRLSMRRRDNSTGGVIPG